MNIRKSLVPVALAAALVFSLPAAFAADAPANKAEKRLELLRANAGEPVKTVKFLRPMHGFEVVGPHNVLVWETPFKAWLLDLREKPPARSSRTSGRSASRPCTTRSTPRTATSSATTASAAASTASARWT